MKSIEIILDGHRAVIRFKKISDKKFSSLRWRLIEQNISAIESDSINNKFDKSPSTHDDDKR